MTEIVRFLFSSRPLFRPTVGPMKPPFPWVTRVLSSVINRPFTEVNNEWIYIYIYRERERERAEADIYIMHVYVFYIFPEIRLEGFKAGLFTIGILSSGTW